MFRRLSNHPSRCSSFDIPKLLLYRNFQVGRAYEYIIVLLPEFCQPT